MPCYVYQTCTVRRTWSRGIREIVECELVEPGGGPPRSCRARKIDDYHYEVSFTPDEPGRWGIDVTIKDFRGWTSTDMFFVYVEKPANQWRSTILGVSTYARRLDASTVEICAEITLRYAAPCSWTLENVTEVEAVTESGVTFIRPLSFVFQKGSDVARACTRIYTEEGGHLTKLKVPSEILVTYDPDTCEVKSCEILSWYEVPSVDLERVVWEPAVGKPNILAVELYVDGGYSAEAPPLAGAGPVLRAVVKFDRAPGYEARVRFQLYGLEKGGKYYRPVRAATADPNSDTMEVELWRVGDVLAEAIANEVPIEPGDSYTLKVYAEVIE